MQSGESRVARGRRFETVAAAYLRERGYLILGRNVRFGRGEVDLVVRDPDGVVAFVEVKGRTSLEWGHPLEAIHRKKRREVEAVARWWIRTREPAPGYRFDAVAVDASGAPGAPESVTHLRDAWRPGDLFHH